MRRTLIVGVMLLSACGGGGEEIPAQQVEEGSAQTPSPTEAAAFDFCRDMGMIEDLSRDVRKETETRAELIDRANDLQEETADAAETERGQARQSLEKVADALGHLTVALEDDNEFAAKLDAETVSISTATAAIRLGCS